MTTFDELAIAYDSTIDWESRLAREIPFLKECIAKDRARVLDMACGSGRHAIALARENHNVTGFDNSKSMIQIARSLADSEGATVDFLVEDMLHMGRFADEKYDLIYCIGNSLELLNDLNALEKVFKLVHKSLKDGGTFVFQILNFEEIIASDFRFMPSKSGKLDTGEEVIFNRFFDHKVGKNYSNLVFTSIIRSDNNWISEINTQNVLRLDFNIVDNLLTRSNFRDIIVFSDYSGDGFVQTLHRNMIVKVRK